MNDRDSSIPRVAVIAMIHQLQVDIHATNHCHSAGRELERMGKMVREWRPDERLLRP